MVYHVLTVLCFFVSFHVCVIFVILSFFIDFRPIFFSLRSGAMVIIGRGTTAQPLIATLIQLAYTLVLLKLAPYLNGVDDWVNFLTSMSLCVTMLLGFALAGDTANSSELTRDFDELVFSSLLISVTVVCITTELFAMFWSKFGEKIQLEWLRLQLAAEAEWEDEGEENADGQIAKSVLPPGWGLHN